jgi:hypothetical protein
MAEEGNAQIEPTDNNAQTMDIGQSLDQGIFKGTDLAKEWEQIQQNKPQEPVAEESKDPLAAALANAKSEDLESSSQDPESTGQQPAVEDPAVQGSEDALVIESPLFGGKKSLTKDTLGAEGNQDAFIEPDLENIEQVNSYLKDTFGVEGFSALSERLEGSKKLENDYKTAKGQVDSFSNLFENMDPDLYQAIDAYAKGGDWKAVLSSPAVDFSKDVSGIDSKKLVNTFSPGKISEEDWQEYSDPEGDATVKRLVDSVIETSKAAFTNAKSEKERSAQQAVQKQQQRNEAYSTSLGKSKEIFQSEYSTIDPSAMAQIDDVLTKEGVASLFFNNDGSAKEDAYETVAMAKFGKDLIKEFETIAMRKAETKVNQEVLLRTPQAPKDDRGTSSTEAPTGVRPEVQEAYEKMMAQAGKQRHF